MSTEMFTGIVDIHHDDGSYDLDEVVAGGVTALWHKATEGVTFHDPKFVRAMDGARAAGLLRGAYHFARGTSDAVAQADEFLATVQKITAPEEVLLALDLEGSLDDPKTMTTSNAAAFVLRVREVTGRWPVLYAGLSKLRARMRDADESTRDALGHCPLWLAAYNCDPASLTPPSPWSAWSLQQYTNGAEGPKDEACYPRETKGFHRLAQDRSAFRGTPDELRVWWTSAGRESR